MYYDFILLHLVLIGLMFSQKHYYNTQRLGSQHHVQVEKGLTLSSCVKPEQRTSKGSVSSSVSGAGPSDSLDMQI